MEIEHVHQMSFTTLKINVRASLALRAFVGRCAISVTVRYFTLMASSRAPCKPFLITYEKRFNWTASDNETDVTKLLLC